MRFHFALVQVHRGGVNAGLGTRSILMLIFGRLWWEDRTNYGAEDYGGVRSDDPRQPVAFATRVARRVASRAAAASGACDGTTGAAGGVEAARLRERMYWGLTNLWEEGLALELALERRAAGAG